MRGWLILMAGGLALAGCGKQPAASMQIYGVGRCGGVPKGWQRTEKSRLGDNFVQFLIGVDRRGALSWNWLPVDEVRLKDNLQQAAALPVGPEIGLIFDEATPCDEVAKVRRIVTDHPMCGYEGQCLEYTKTQWLAGHPKPRPAPISPA